MHRYVSCKWVLFSTEFLYTVNLFSFLGIAFVVLVGGCFLIKRDIIGAHYLFGIPLCRMYDTVLGLLL